jgi:hypothetical protein
MHPGGIMADGAHTSSPAPQAQNYFARHWRGELSLPLSYWGNGFLVSFTTGLLVAAITEGLRDRYEPTRALGSMALLYFTIAVTLTWQVVGVWRSANRYLHRGGSGVWAGLAKCAMILGVLRTLVDFGSHGLPQLIETAKIVAGDPGTGPHLIRVLRDGTEVELAGGITFGVTGELRRVLDATPAIKVIHLNSGGGRVAEARRLRDLIRERGLVTYAASECDSACTIAFVGGTSRYIGPSGRLGFHQGAFPGITPEEMRLQTELDKAALIRAGVDPKFAERAYAIPNSEMWHPTNDELLAAHVITGIAKTNDFAWSGVGAKTAEDFGREFVKIRAFAALQKYEPVTFSKMTTEVADALSRGRTEAEAVTNGRAVLGEAATKYLAIASDKAVFDYTSVMTSELQQLGAKDPDACYYFLVPHVGKPINIAEYVNADTRSRDLDSLADLIETGAAMPQRVPAAADVDASLQTVIGKLQQRFGQDFSIFAKLNDPNVDHRKVCEIVTALYTEVLRQPTSQSIPLLRYMFSQK